LGDERVDIGEGFLDSLLFADLCTLSRSSEMAQHPSLKSASKIITKRNVLKRFERIDLLRERGKWQDGDRGLGLPKTKPE
jgi:small basic protein (TIGR04137 family)